MREELFGTEPEAVRFAVAHGHPGIADLVNSDGIRTITNEDGSGGITVGIAGKRVALGYRVPAALLRGIDIKAEGMAINDPHAFVLSVGDGDELYSAPITDKGIGRDAPAGCG
jgi:hypothetical protein